MRYSPADELLTFLFNGQPHLLAPPISTWLTSSRRFTAFVTTFRDKIRKKLRTTQDPESLLDLRLELETAYLLLQERSFSLAYEPQPGGKSRGPDFAVSFTTSLTFMVEVTRLRGDQKSSPGNQQEQTLGTRSANSNPIIPPIDDDLADAICSKLGQLLPQCSNVMVVGIKSQRLTQEALRGAMLHLQQRAERNDATVVQRYGFRDRSDFFHHYQRLSELLIRESDLQPDEPLISWVNPQAKYPLPSKVRTALYRSQNI